MRAEVILGLIGGFGALLVILPFLNIPFFSDNKSVFLITGLIIFAIYRKITIDESNTKLKSIEKKLNSIEVNIKDKLNEQNQKISKIGGWIEAINFFKGKKGFLDPVILIIIVVVIIIIILALQGKL